MKGLEISLWMITLLIVILVLVAWLMISKNRRQENVTVATHGDALASQYCGSCHLFPEPQLLDKKTWRDGVLPNMAMRLGMRMPGQDPFKGMDTVEIGLVRSLNVYPEQHLISQGEWQQIEDYYTTQAPNEPLPQQAVTPIQSGLQQFQAQPIYIGDTRLPNTSLLKYDNRHGKLYVGDGKKEVYIFNKDLSLASNWFMPSPPVDIDFSGDLPRLLCIGSIAPSQQRTGNFSLSIHLKIQPHLLYGLIAWHDR